MTAFVRCRGYNGLHFTRDIWTEAAQFDQTFREHEKLPTDWVGDWILGRKLLHISLVARRQSGDGKKKSTYPFIGFFMKSAAPYTLTPANSMAGERRGSQRLNPPQLMKAGQRSLRSQNHRSRYGAVLCALVCRLLELLFS